MDSPCVSQTAVVAAGPILSDDLGIAALVALSGGSAAFLVREIEAAIEMAVVGLFVFGSRANRPPPREAAATATGSDLDLLIFVDRPATGGIWGDAGSLAIDAHVFGIEEGLGSPPSRWMIYQDSRLLFDRSPPLMAQWLARLQTWIQDTVDPWNRAERLRDEVWTQRMIRRVAVAAIEDPVRATLYEARLLAEIAALHNQARGRFNSSLSHWWRGVRTEETAMGEALERYMMSRCYPPDPDALDALFRVVRGLD